MQSNISVHLKSALAEAAWLSKRRNVLYFLILIVFVGGLVRFANLGYSSFWGDEAWIALSKRQDSFIPDGSIRFYTLLQNLFWYLTVRCLGESEFSLRLPSALYGLMTVILSYHITRKLTASSLAGLCTAALAVCNDNWLYSSRECKPQAGELLALSTVSFVFISYFQNNLDWRHALFSFFLLALAIGMGNWAAIVAGPSIFIAICLRLGSATDRPDKHQLFLMATTLIAVLFTTLAWYVWLRQVTASQPDFMDFVHRFYAARGWLPPKDGGFLERLVWTFRAFISLPTHLYPHWSKPGKVLWVFAILATIYGFIRWPREVSFYRVWVGVVVLLFAGLGFAGRFPWGNRLTEWVNVAFLPFAGFGLAQFLGQSSVRAGIFRIGFAILITAALGRQIYRTVVVPEVWTHMRPLVRYLEDHTLDGDHIFVYFMSVPAFDYYWKGNPSVQLEKVSFPRGDDQRWKQYLLKLPCNTFATWMLFSQDGNPPNSESELVQGILGELGMSYTTFEEVGARLIRVPPQARNLCSSTNSAK